MPGMPRVLLLANTVFEYVIAFGGFFLLDQPILAANALGFGTLSLAMLRLKEADAYRPGMVALAVFHTVIALVWLLNALGGSFSPVLIVHAVFAAAFLYALFQR